MRRNWHTSLKVSFWNFFMEADESEIFFTYHRKKQIANHEYLIWNMKVFLTIFGCHHKIIQKMTN